MTRLRRLGESLYVLSLALWVGGMWVVGYLVVPALFANLGDRQLAGNLAGRLLAQIAWVGLVVSVYALTFLFSRWGASLFRRPVFWLHLLLAALVAANLFGLQPLMAQLKAEASPLDVMESAMRDRFVMWHGISSVLYVLQSLLGGAVVLWSVRDQR